MKKKKIIILSIMIIVVALLLEASILKYVNDRNAHRTSKVLLDRVITVLDKNDESRNELIESLKDDYIVRAKAVSYMIDADPAVEYDVDELQKIAKLMAVDEIHLFDDQGTIYSGSALKYFGYNFDSGAQMEYFKPMLKNKSLTMCQDVIPNTAEGKKMMYAITWNESGDRMIQVGIEPVRLLEKVKQNEVSTIVSNMPMYEGISLYVADIDTGEIYGATDRTKIGQTLEDIGLSKKQLSSGKETIDTVTIDNEKCSCIFESSGSYEVGVTFAISSNRTSNFIAMMILAVYLFIAAGIVLVMVFRVLRANQEKQEQFAILSSMSEIYYSMYLVNLKTNAVVEYSRQNEGKEIHTLSQKADEMMHQITDRLVIEAYKEQAEQFTDLHTAAQRMEGKKIISGEFVGQKLGWFRASFIASETDKDQKPVKLIFTIRSIDDEKRKEEKLIYTSNTDQLTGCFNRRAYEKDIAEMDLNTEFIYLSMDVNGLKIVNDSLGHEAGDELLKGASYCMKKCFDDYGKVYRIGGDEFIVILFTNYESFAKIKEAFDNTVANWSGELVSSITVSCGIVSGSEQPWASWEEISRIADRRMYEQKAIYYRKNCIDRYSHPTG